jgi:PPM family protein phosphatase
MRMQRRECPADRPRDVAGVGRAPHIVEKRVLRAHGITDRGRTRPVNEDCFAVDERLRLLVVADGMGGHSAGEVAARLAVDAVVESVRDRANPGLAGGEAWPLGFDPTLSDGGNVLRTAIQLANLRILEAALTTDSLFGMGTTIVAALADGPRLSVAHVGDSRLYLASRGRLRLLTDDDSWIARILACDPALDVAALRRHPMRGALTNVVGSRQGTTVHVAEEVLEGGELLLLTTDGVHGVLETAELEAIVFAGDHDGDPRRLAARLVAGALDGGSLDNCTAIVARYDRD